MTQKPHDTESWVRQKYVMEGLSMRQVAELAGCHESSVRTRLLRFGIPIRSRSKALALARRPADLRGDRDWLYQRYVVEQRSARMVGELAGCSETAIYRALRRFGIPSRTIAEGTKLVKGTPKARKRHSEKMTAHYADPKARQKTGAASRAAWARGDFDTPEYRKKLSDRVRARYADPEYRQKMGEALKARSADPEWHQKLSDASRVSHARGAYDDVYTDPERRRKQGDAMKAAWARGDFDGVFQSPTTIELAVVQALNALGLTHECEYRPPGYTCVYDVLVYPDILIEVQGDYWHTLPGRAERDAEKAAWARGQGFVVIELWGHDIREAMAAGTMADFVRGHIEAAYA